MQAELNFQGLWRHDDPQTSRDAAKSFDTTTLEKIVYNAIKSYGAQGCISDDVMARIPNIPLVSISPRYKRLIEKRLIEDTGERRPGISGRGQRVMRALA